MEFLFFKTSLVCILEYTKTFYIRRTWQLCGGLSILWQSCGHCWVFQICWHIECSPNIWFLFTSTESFYHFTCVYTAAFPEITLHFLHTHLHGNSPQPTGLTSPSTSSQKPSLTTPASNDTPMFRRLAKLSLYHSLSEAMWGMNEK